MNAEKWKKIEPAALDGNVFRMIGKQWMLVSAGTLDSHNTMTASWGGLGVLWFRPVAFVFIRPTRHTFGFMEGRDLFSLSFLPESRRDALDICGRLSGRDVNKDEQANITPFEPQPGVVAYRDAGLVIVCRKIHSQDLDAGRFIDPTIDANYPEKDYHRIYVGEIISCLAAT